MLPLSWEIIQQCKVFHLNRYCTVEKLFLVILLTLTIKKLQADFEGYNFNKLEKGVSSRFPRLSNQHNGSNIKNSNCLCTSHTRKDMASKTCLMDVLCLEYERYFSDFKHLSVRFAARNREIGWGRDPLTPVNCLKTCYMFLLRKTESSPASKSSQLRVW